LIEELNLSCAALLGQQRRSLEGKPLSESIAPEDRGRLKAHIRECFKTNASLTVELVVRLKGGGFCPIEVVSVQVPQTGATVSAPFFRS